MKSVRRFELDPSITVSLVAAGLFVGAFGSSTLTRTIAAIFKGVWLYLSNTRG